MIEKNQVIRVNGGLAVIIPVALAESTGIKEGDDVQFSLSENRLVVSLSDHDSSHSLEDAREFMRTHRQAFQQLGK